MTAVLRFVAALVVAILVVAITGYWIADLAPNSRAGRAIAALVQPTPQASDRDPGLPPIAIGGPFTLVDQTGRTVTQNSYPGRWLLVYFGYTTCPDVCPTSLQAIASALDSLGPKADQVVPLFITVDPERDTPAVLARYTALFDKRIIGLTGSAAQIKDAETTYRVYAAKVPEPGTNSYLMDHTSFLYLMSPKGELVAMFDRNVTATALSVAIQKRLN